MSQRFLTGRGPLLRAAGAGSFPAAARGVSISAARLFAVGADPLRSACGGGFPVAAAGSVSFPAAAEEVCISVARLFAVDVDPLRSAPGSCWYSRRLGC